MSDIVQSVYYIYMFLLFFVLQYCVNRVVLFIFHSVGYIDMPQVDLISCLECLFLERRSREGAERERRQGKRNQELLERTFRQSIIQAGLWDRPFGWDFQPDLTIHISKSLTIPTLSYFDCQAFHQSNSGNFTSLFLKNLQHAPNSVEHYHPEPSVSGKKPVSKQISSPHESPQYIFVGKSSKMHWGFHGCRWNKTKNTLHHKILITTVI